MRAPTAFIVVFVVVTTPSVTLKSPSLLCLAAEQASSLQDSLRQANFTSCSIFCIYMYSFFIRTSSQPLSIDRIQYVSTRRHKLPLCPCGSELHFRSYKDRLASSSCKIRYLASKELVRLPFIHLSLSLWVWKQTLSPDHSL